MRYGFGCCGRGGDEGGVRGGRVLVGVAVAERVVMAMVKAGVGKGGEGRGRGWDGDGGGGYEGEQGWAWAWGWRLSSIRLEGAGKSSASEARVGHRESRGDLIVAAPAVSRRSTA